MFDLFGKLWLQGVKRLLKAQATQTTRQRKLHEGMRKAAVKAVKAAQAPAVKAASKSLANVAAKASRNVARTAAKTAIKTAVKTARKNAPRQPDRQPASQPAARGRKTSGGRLANAGGRSDAGRAGQPSRSVALDETNASALDAGGSWRRVYQTSRAVVGGTRARRLGGWLFLPAASRAEAAAAADRPLPLLVMLHGCGQTAPAFASGTRMNRLAAQHGFAVLYPQQSASAHAQRCWPWYRRSLQEGGDELALIAAMVERTCERHALDGHRVYVAGLSAGAALAHNLALRRPDLFAAVALHSGPVHGAADSRMSAFGVMQQGSRDALQPIARLQRERGAAFAMPSLIIQGEEDQVVRPVNGRQLLTQCCAVNGLDADTAASRRYPARAGCDAYRVTDVRQGSRTLVRLVEVAHLAHAWSGGDASLRFNAASGPDASMMIWRFLRHHARQRASARISTATFDAAA